MKPARDQATFLRRLWAMEDALIKAGLRAMPPWWRETLGRFYLSGRRRLVVRKGRRVFASTCVAPRLAVAEMLFGEHEHIPGTPPIVYAFLSVKRDEAANRLRGVRAILDVLNVNYTERADTIELTDYPAILSVVTANARTAVGSTVGFAFLDEVSRWLDDSLSNPAELVVGSLMPALATLPDAKLFLVSSPLTRDDFHARQFDLGDTPHQLVAWGATWTINPTLTEEATRALEPDERTWRREYAAEPSESVEENWFGTALDAAISDEPPPELVTGIRPFLAIDPAFANDRFGWAAVASWQGALDPATKRPRRITYTYGVGAWKPDKPRQTMERLRDEVCEKYLPDRGQRLTTVYTDQAEYYSLSEIARGVGIHLELVPWVGGSGEGSKLARFKAVRLAMRQGDFKVPNEAGLLRSFRSVRGVLTAAGNERIETPRTSQGHGDDVSALVLAGSVALSIYPSAPVVVRPQLTQQELDYERAVKECLERQRRRANSRGDLERRIRAIR
jgi:hypothetical protein